MLLCCCVQGDSKAAKGVVLFMHGFAQGPNAYYENLQGLADAGFLVVAPVPPFGITPGAQQVPTQRPCSCCSCSYHESLMLFHG
jgi:hypothetical protein